jgi:hypothetical protein
METAVDANCLQVIPKLYFFKIMFYTFCIKKGGEGRQGDYGMRATARHPQNHKSLLPYNCELSTRPARHHNSHWSKMASTKDAAAMTELLNTLSFLSDQRRNRKFSILILEPSF